MSSLFPQSRTVKSQGAATLPDTASASNVVTASASDHNDKGGAFEMSRESWVTMLGWLTLFAALAILVKYAPP